jgi:hypothetical protein
VEALAVEAAALGLKLEHFPDIGSLRVRLVEWHRFAAVILDSSELPPLERAQECLQQGIALGVWLEQVCHARARQRAQLRRC